MGRKEKSQKCSYTVCMIILTVLELKHVAKGYFDNDDGQNYSFIL